MTEFAIVITIFINSIYEVYIQVRGFKKKYMYYYLHKCRYIYYIIALICVFPSNEHDSRKVMLAILSVIERLPT